MAQRTHSSPNEQGRVDIKLEVTSVTEFETLVLNPDELFTSLMLETYATRSTSGKEHVKQDHLVFVRRTNEESTEDSSTEDTVTLFDDKKSHGFLVRMNPELNDSCISVILTKVRSGTGSPCFVCICKADFYVSELCVLMKPALERGENSSVRIPMYMFNSKINVDVVVTPRKKDMNFFLSIAKRTSSPKVRNDCFDSLLADADKLYREDASKLGIDTNDLSSAVLGSGPTRTDLLSFYNYSTFGFEAGEILSRLYVAQKLFGFVKKGDFAACADSLFTATGVDPDITSRVLQTVAWTLNAIQSTTYLPDARRMPDGRLETQIELQQPLCFGSDDCESLAGICHAYHRAVIAMVLCQHVALEHSPDLCALARVCLRVYIVSVKCELKLDDWVGHCTSIFAPVSNHFRVERREATFNDKYCPAVPAGVDMKNFKKRLEPSEAESLMGVSLFRPRGLKPVEPTRVAKIMAARPHEPRSRPLQASASSQNSRLPHLLCVDVFTDRALTCFEENISRVSRDKAVFIIEPTRSVALVHGSPIHRGADVLEEIIRDSAAATAESFADIHDSSCTEKYLRTFYMTEYDPQSVCDEALSGIVRTALASPSEVRGFHLTFGSNRVGRITYADGCPLDSFALEKPLILREGDDHTDIVSRIAAIDGFVFRPPTFPSETIFQDFRNTLDQNSLHFTRRPKEKYAQDSLYDQTTLAVWIVPAVFADVLLRNAPMNQESKTGNPIPARSVHEKMVQEIKARVGKMVVCKKMTTYLMNDESSRQMFQSTCRQFDIVAFHPKIPSQPSSTIMSSCDED